MGQVRPTYAAIEPLPAQVTWRTSRHGLAEYIYIPAQWNDEINESWPLYRLIIYLQTELCAGLTEVKWRG